MLTEIQKYNKKYPEISSIFLPQFWLIFIFLLFLDCLYLTKDDNKIRKVFLFFNCIVKYAENRRYFEHLHTQSVWQKCGYCLCHIGSVRQIVHAQSLDQVDFWILSVTMPFKKIHYTNCFNNPHKTNYLKQ